MKFYRNTTEVNFFVCPSTLNDYATRYMKVIQDLGQHRYAFTKKKISMSKYHRVHILTNKQYFDIQKKEKDEPYGTNHNVVEINPSFVDRVKDGGMINYSKSFVNPDQYLKF